MSYDLEVPAGSLAQEEGIDSLGDVDELLSGDLFAPWCPAPDVAEESPQECQASIVSSAHTIFQLDKLVSCGSKGVKKAWASNTHLGSCVCQCQAAG